MGFQSFQDFNVDDVTNGLSYIRTKDKINKCLLKKCVPAKVYFTVLSLMFYFFWDGYKFLHFFSKKY